MQILIILLFLVPTLIIIADFIRYLIAGKRFTKIILFRVLEFIIVLGYPLFYLVVVDEHKNDCCTDSATFSPEHSLTIYVLIAICMVAYLFSTFRKKISSPIAEVLISCALLFGIVFNIILSTHVVQPLWLFGNLPVMILFLMQMLRNHQLFLTYSNSASFKTGSGVHAVIWKILKLKLIYQFPFLLILCLPLLAALAGFLMLFGQQQDSAIRAFTDTYKHGLSQLDHVCYNVECGGHFLCSMAAGGHHQIVKPERFGERLGMRIICNRQLLVANAFENLVETRLPGVHQIIRRHYNKVGDQIHRYYWVFENKFIADSIYLLMKPLEWMFLVVLYTFDQNPENRIARQYLSPIDREMSEQKLSAAKDEGF